MYKALFFERNEPFPETIHNLVIGKNWEQISPLDMLFNKLKFVVLLSLLNPSSTMELLKLLDVLFLEKKISPPFSLHSERFQ